MITSLKNNDVSLLDLIGWYIMQHGQTAVAENNTKQRSTIVARCRDYDQWRTTQFLSSTSNAWWHGAPEGLRNRRPGAEVCK